uniref:Uncharacterized protein n=1 Tax=Phakopsora pachyrhizi TaxID=170000 RepID=A0A0S1MJ19_PHAPC
MGRYRIIIPLAGCLQRCLWDWSMLRKLPQQLVQVCPRRKAAPLFRVQFRSSTPNPWRARLIGDCDVQEHQG